MSSDYKDHLYALILAGGGGTRMWPKSREATPKQFLKLFDNKTLIEITAERLAKFIPWEKIYVITVSENYKKEIKKYASKIHPENIIVEPARRDSGPAHALGALAISKVDSQAVIINAAADHLISPQESFEKTVKTAAKAAFDNQSLVAIGIKPSYPHTGLGHIRKGEKKELINGEAVYRIDAFVEKPKISLAKKFTESGKYYWNAGQYVWRADTILTAFNKHAPEISKNLKVISEALGTEDEKKIVAASYEKMPKISVDYAISEKARNFLLVVGDYSWTDIGDWNEVWKHLPKDSAGNVVVDGKEPGGEVMNLEASNTFIHTDGRLIALINVDNLVVVDTKDALLICNKEKSQNVKNVVERLKKEKKSKFL